MIREKGGCHKGKFTGVAWGEQSTVRIKQQSNDEQLVSDCDTEALNKDS